MVVHRCEPPYVFPGCTDAVHENHIHCMGIEVDVEVDVDVDVDVDVAWQFCHAVAQRVERPLVRLPLPNQLDQLAVMFVVAVHSNLSLDRVYRSPLLRWLLAKKLVRRFDGQSDHHFSIFWNYGWSTNDHYVFVLKKKLQFNVKNFKILSNSGKNTINF